MIKSDKATLSFMGMTFELQEPMKIEPLGQDTIKFTSPRIAFGEPEEIKVTYEWQPNSIFYVGRKVRIEGVLCEVCSVEKDGSFTVQRIEEVGE
jgi:hypothetical protein